MSVDDKLKRYVRRKIGQLDRYLPKHSRQSLRVEVKLKDGKAKDKNEYTCEIIAHLPQETITLSEKSISAQSAVDITEDKLKNQFKKYKQMHSDPKFYRRLLARFKRGSRSSS